MVRPYRNSLLSCFSPFSLCVKASCCPCIVSGRNHHRIHHGDDREYSACNSWCVAWCGLGIGGFGWVLQMLDRRRMMAKYDLEGSRCGTCCTSCCCFCCELIQTEKELDFISLSRSNPESAYQIQSNMVAEPKYSLYDA